MSDWGTIIAEPGPSAAFKDTKLELLLDASGTGAEAPHAKAASENMKQDIVRNDDEGLMLLNMLMTFEICIERIDDCVDDGCVVLRNGSGAKVNLVARN